jgi:hypothetical protein
MGRPLYARNIRLSSYAFQKRVHVVTESAAFHPFSILFMGKGAGAKMNYFCAFVFQYLSHGADVIAGAAAGKNADDFGVSIR